MALESTEDPGAVAQLGERHVRNVEVGGSIPLGSTSFFGSDYPEILKSASRAAFAVAESIFE